MVVSFSYLYQLVLLWKSILPDIKMATPACFLGPFLWNIFPFFDSEVMYILDIKVCFLDAVERWILPVSILLVFFNREIETTDVERYQ